jgi:hypothetical protein
VCVTYYDGDLPNYMIQIYQVSGFTSESASLAIQVQNGVASGGDFVMLIESGPMLTILKKNTDEMYLRFAGKFLQDISCSISTNGNWFALSQGNSFEIFSLDEAGNFIQVNQIVETAHIHMLHVALDNSITIFRGDALVTYEINQENSAWEPTTTTSINTAINLCGYLTDSSFAGIDTTRGMVSLFARQDNGSWSNVENFVYDMYSIRDISSLSWIGNTIIMTKLVPCSTYGVTYVFTKVNGHWTRSTTRRAGEIELPLGMRLIKADVLMIDESTAYVSVLAPAPRPPVPEPEEDDHDEDDDTNHDDDDDDTNHRRNVQREGSPPIIGRVFLLHNMNNEWTYQAKIVPPFEMTTEFGAGIVETTDNHLFFGCEMQMNSPSTCGFFSLGTCYDDPVQLTCDDLIIEDCSMLTYQIDIDLLYTLDNPQCGRPFGVMYSVIARNERTLEYSFFLYKPFSNDVASCNMTATCPVPISTVKEVPITAPVSVPIANVVSSPKAESDSVSSADKVVAAISLILATILVV